MKHRSKTSPARDIRNSTALLRQRFLQARDLRKPATVPRLPELHQTCMLVSVPMDTAGRLVLSAQIAVLGLRKLLKRGARNPHVSSRTRVNGMLCTAMVHAKEMGRQEALQGLVCGGAGTILGKPLGGPSPTLSGVFFNTWYGLYSLSSVISQRGVQAIRQITGQNLSLVS